jgi:putative copper export protein
VKDFYLLSIIVSIGLLYTIGFLLAEDRGRLSKEANRIKNLAVLATLIWLVCVIGEVVVEVANLLGEGFLSAFNWTALSTFATSTNLGRDYLFQIVMGFVSIALVVLSKKIGSIYFALAATMLALLIPLFQSHAASAGNHGLAIGALIFHVGAVSLWVGGVIGLLLINPRERSASISRFSRMALWAAIIVGVSGLLSAWSRLNFVAGWRTQYGAIVISKALLFIILLAFGAKHRRVLSEKIDGDRQRFRLLLNESLVMVEHHGATNISFLFDSRTRSRPLHYGYSHAAIALLAARFGGILPRWNNVGVLTFNYCALHLRGCGFKTPW